MQPHELVGARADLERVQVHHESEGGDDSDERDRRRARDAAQEREVAGEHRQHEEAQVARKPRRDLVAEQLGARVAPARRREPGDLHEHGRENRERQHRRHREPSTLVGFGCDELLPHAVAVLASELGGQLVDLAEPADRDRERLVGTQARGFEVGDLLAQVTLELVGIRLVDRPAAS